MVGKCHKSWLQVILNGLKIFLNLKKDFIKCYDDESDEGYYFNVGVQYPEKLHDLHNDLPFLPKRMKIGKVEKLSGNLHDKTEYVFT